MVILKINANEANQRIDKYIRKYLNNAPLSFIYSLFRKKDIKVNNKKTNISYLLKEGDVLTIYLSEKQLNDFHSKKELIEVPFNEEIVYEDDNLLIVNKRKNLLVHGDKKEKTHTLTNQVLNYLFKKGEYDPHTTLGFTPAPSHRLDRNTSGQIIFAKNLISQQAIEKMLHDRRGLRRFYLCLVSGVVKSDLIINTPLKKDENRNLVFTSSLIKGGQEALTKIKVLQRFKNYSLLEVELISGRTHQIRVHLKSINHPIVGDSKYGNLKVNNDFYKTYKYDKPFLHASILKFEEIDGHLAYLSNKQFTCPLDKDEEKIINLLNIDGETNDKK